MPRLPHKRHVRAMPAYGLYKPAGVPARELDDVILAVDEYEAIRLADLEGLYQEQVAEKMGVSRQTVGRILRMAHRKVAEALVLGKALRIEGGAYITESERRYLCRSCGAVWAGSMESPGARACPACGVENDFET